MNNRVVIFAAGVLIVGAAVLWTLFPLRNPQRDVGTEATDAVALKGHASPRPSSRAPMQPQGNVAGSTNDSHGPIAPLIQLTPEQAEAYVQENHRSVTSLLAARRASGEKSFLREAMERFPNDPRVAFDAYFLNGPYESKAPATPDRRSWLDNFRQADPNNALPDYLAARDDFKAGRTEQALQDLQAASGKTRFDAYLMESLQSTEEAYRAAGYPETDVKSTAAWGLLLPHLQETRQLAENMADLATQYQNAGDTASAQNILQMGMSLGQQVSSEFPVINTLVGIAIQKKLLATMDPASPYLDTGMTVQDQIDTLNQYRQSLKALAPQVEQVLPRLSEADTVNFYDRLRLFGEPAAVKWAVEKYGTQ